MTSISAPSTVRQWKNYPAINSAMNDSITENGVRTSIPLYFDPTTTQRKELLNAIRDKARSGVIQQNTHTGLSVETASSNQSDVEAYVGMSLDVLRSVIFQRGGIEAGLFLRLQQAAGVELITQKEIAAAFKDRLEVVKNYTNNFPFIQSNEE